MYGRDKGHPGESVFDSLKSKDGLTRGELQENARKVLTYSLYKRLDT